MWLFILRDCEGRFRVALFGLDTFLPRSIYGDNMYIIGGYARVRPKRALLFSSLRHNNVLACETASTSAFVASIRRRDNVRDVDKIFAPWDYFNPKLRWHIFYGSPLTALAVTRNLRHTYIQCRVYPRRPEFME